MTNLQYLLLDCLMIYKMENTDLEAIMLMLREPHHQKEMIEWIALNRKATTSKVLEQAIKIYSMNN